MEQSKRDLEAKRDHLIKELELVNQEIADVDNRLSQLPTALQQLEAEKQEQAHQTYQLHKSIKIVPGSTEADIQEIQIADDIPACDLCNPECPGTLMNCHSFLLWWKNF